MTRLAETCPLNYIVFDAETEREECKGELYGGRGGGHRLKGDRARLVKPRHPIPHRPFPKRELRPFAYTTSRDVHRSSLDSITLHSSNRTRDFPWYRGNAAVRRCEIREVIRGCEDEAEEFLGEQRREKRCAVNGSGVNQPFMEMRQGEDGLDSS